MNCTDGMKGSSKFTLTLIALFTALLLFTAFFTLLLNDTIFNSTYYRTAFERLGTYSLIAELAGEPAKDLTNKISESSGTSDLPIQEKNSVIDQQKTLMKSLVEDNVSDKMVRLNINSLIDGLLSYFKGETNSLPDLHLTGLAALKNVNLQVLIMYTGESQISNILRFLRLAQYTLVHIPLFLLFLFPIIMVSILKKRPGDIQYWVLRTVSFYFLLSLAVGMLINVFPCLLIKYIPVNIDLFRSSLSGLLSGQLFYFVRVIMLYTFLSGSLPYIGVRSVALLNKRFVTFEQSEAMLFPLSTPKKKTIPVVAIVLISGLIFFLNLQTSSFEFYSRNLGQTLALLWENNPIYRVINARNDLIYLLEVHMIDGNTKKPCANVGVNIWNSGNQDTPCQSSSAITDSDGIASFMLKKGMYTLTLDSYNIFSGFDVPQPHSYQFELLTPGKSELSVILGEKSGSLPYVAEASLQFIP